jgi:hypothetical protein
LVLARQTPPYRVGAWKELFAAVSAYVTANKIDFKYEHVHFAKPKESFFGVISELPSKALQEISILKIQV